MILDGSFYFDLQIGNSSSTETYSNFIELNNLLAFKMTEYTGASGILIECIIRLGNDKIKNLFIQNNPIVIKLGETKETAQEIHAEITEVNLAQDAQSAGHIVTFAAVLSVKYYQETFSNSLTGTSLDVLEFIQRKCIDFNKGIDLQGDFDPEIHELTRSGKPMTWINNYKTGMKFTTDTWLHMNLGKDKCPLIVLNKEGYFSVIELNEHLKYSEPKCKFVTATSGKAGGNEILYLNNFTPRSYKLDSNLFCGFGNILNIRDVESGKDEIETYKGSVDLASSKDNETTDAGYKTWTNKYQTANTYKNYKKQYYKNVFKLVQLSSMVGEVITAGYIKDVNVADMVELNSDDNIYTGRYIINTKVTTFSSNTPIQTVFYICRDNRNFIENSNLNKKYSIKNALMTLFNQQLANTLQSIRNLRRLVIMGRQILDGTFIKRSIAYLNNFKYNMLTSFSLFGTTINFNDKLALIDSLKAAGNSFCNQLINAFLPYPYNYVFKDFAVTDINMKGILSKLLYEFSPSQELRGLLIEITELFSDLTHKASDLYDNGYKQMKLNEYSESGYGSLSYYDGKSPYMETDMSLLTDQEKIQAITDEFIANTDGADIPIPQVDLTESEGLLPMDDLRDLMANKTVIKLREKGYLWGIDNFREILLGEEPMDFNTISKINENIGNMLYARYWGTFKDPSELTDFFVKNAFKDIYVTVPTTKIINALRGSKVFMALPKLEENLTFYINNKEVEMEVLEDLNLGLYTISGYPLLYNVYMSKGTFNSNSTILEVRKGRV